MLKTTNNITILFVISILFTSCVNLNKSSKNEYTDLSHWLERTVDTVMIESSIPSMALGIIKNDQQIIKKGFGTLSRESSDSTTIKSLYQICSLSKMLTGIIANSLIAEGTLNVDKTLSDYLGNELSNNARQKFKNTKIVQILQHTAGIPNEACSVHKNWQINNYWLDGYNKTELLVDIEKMDLEFASGSKYEYSNSGYAILAYVLEKASGKTYSELLNTYVSKPYGLKNTFVMPSKAQQKEVATPYLPSNRSQANPTSDWGLAVAASGVYSNLEDIFTLMQAQIAAYNVFEEKGIISPLVLTDNKQTNNKLIKESTYGYRYGLGLIKYVKDNGEIVYVHHGDSDGFGIMYHFTPKSKEGMVYITSCGGKLFIDSYNHIGSKLAGIPYERPKRQLLPYLEYFMQKNDLDTGIEFITKHKNDSSFILRQDAEQIINNWGYEHLNTQQLEKAINLFKLNTTLFPNSANSYDSLGEAYLINGDSLRSLNVYKKAFLLDKENAILSKLIKDFELKIEGIN